MDSGIINSGIVMSGELNQRPKLGIAQKLQPQEPTAQKHEDHRRAIEDPSPDRGGVSQPRA